jgi:SAM-dependent methyltransferase
LELTREPHLPGSKPLSTQLDVGCGAYCLPGAVGIDQKRFQEGQVVGDLNQAPWPLPDHHFEYIRCQHVVEHIANLPVLVREMYRVARSGARIEFMTPHYSCMNSWGDPTHLHHFSLASLPLLFAQNLEAQQFRVISNEIRFTGSFIEFPGWLIYKLSPRQYEKHFAWIWPANEIRTIIEVIK